MRVTNDVTAAPPRTTLTHGLASTSDGPVSVPGRSAVRPPYRNAPPVSSLRCRELDRVETLTNSRPRATGPSAREKVRTHRAARNRWRVREDGRASSLQTGDTKVWRCVVPRMLFFGDNGEQEYDTLIFLTV